MDTSIDVNFLRDKCEKDTVAVVVDGNLRDRTAYPDPARFAVNLREPVKLVYGYDILDATIPSSMYNVSSKNNFLSYVVVQGDAMDGEATASFIGTLGALLTSPPPPGTPATVRFDPGLSAAKLAREAGGLVFDVPALARETSFRVSFESVSLVPGFYTSDTLVSEFGKRCAHLTCSIDPLSYKFRLDSLSTPFIVYLPWSSLAPKLGLFSYANKAFLPSSLSMIGSWSVVSEGIATFKDVSYIILRCDELEEHIYREDVQGASGIGVFKVVDVNDVSHLRFDFVNFARRAFHPISNLARLTFTFQHTDGSLCDFNGLSAMMIIGIKRYMPLTPADFGTQYPLNPNYDPDYRNYRIRRLEMLQRFQRGAARDTRLPPIDEFVREHNAFVRDPKMRLPMREDFEDNESDDTVDSESESDDDRVPFESSIWGRRGTIDFFEKRKNA